MKSDCLWLWKNFVDGRPEYLAFDNPYPCDPSGDPLTLGEPCGYAIVKMSMQGRTDVSEEQVIAAIKRATPASENETREEPLDDQSDEPLREMCFDYRNAVSSHAENYFQRIVHWVKQQAVRQSLAEVHPPDKTLPEDQRDVAWVLAIARALGEGSGFNIPIVPKPEAFKELFDAIRQRSATPATDREAIVEECAKVADAESGRHFSLIGYAPLEDQKRKHGAKAAMAMELAAEIRALKMAGDSRGKT